MTKEQEKTKKISKNDQKLQNTAIAAGVICGNFFPFILANRKNVFTTYEFIAEMAVAFLGHCEVNKYIMGKDPVLDRTGIINWTRDCLNEHPDFKDVVKPADK